MSKTPEEMAEEYASKIYQLKYYVDGRRKHSQGQQGLVWLAGKNGFLAGYKAARQWISVKDRLPEVNTDVLVKVSKGWVESDDNGNNPKPLTYDFYSVMSLYYENNQHVWDTRPVTDACPLKWEDVTHWMPLPAPPKEEE